MFEQLHIPQELTPTDPRFCCGPSLIPQSSVNKLAETKTSLLGTSHRKDAVKNTIKSIQESLKDYFNLPDGYEVILGNGGATFLFDMIPLGICEKKVHHFTCGEFSQKWFQSSKLIPHLTATQTSSEYGMVPEVSLDLANKADLICLTQNETSTGVMVTDLPTLNRDGALVAMDATSGAGQIPTNFQETDLYFFSLQKAFGSEGGLWVAIMSPDALARAQKIEQEKNHYIPAIMSFDKAITNSRKHQTYTTPSVSTLFFAAEKMQEMAKVGFEKIHNESLKKSDLVYGWAQSKSYLKPYVENPKDRSITVATIDVDEKIPVGELLSSLRKKNIVYDIESYRKLGRNQFRIAMFDSISYENLEKLTKLLSHLIEKEL